MPKPAARLVVSALSGLVLMGTTGSSCNIPFLGPAIGPSGTVDVELVNTTAYPVDPGLCVDPEELLLTGSVFRDENLVLVDPAVQPGEIVTLTFDCAEIGTVGTDFALLLVSPTEAVESDNAPAIRQDSDFVCGDVISFIFIDEVGGEFFTRVEVNGQFVMD